jgi:hypothetical protein
MEEIVETESATKSLCILVESCTRLHAFSGKFASPPHSNCEICGTPEETSYHALVECTMARSFWRKLKEIGGIKLPRLCPRTWAIDLLDDHVCKEEDRIVIVQRRP